MTTCKHGHPPEPYCPECRRIRDAAAKRIEANGGQSPRRLRQRQERLNRKANT